MVTAKERTLAVEGKAKPEAKKKTIAKFTVDGQTIIVDHSTMTIRENYLARKLIDDAGFPASAQFLIAGMITIVGRRTHPDLTLDEVVDCVTQADIDAIGEESDEVDDSPQA